MTVAQVLLMTLYVYIIIFEIIRIVNYIIPGPTPVSDGAVLSSARPSILYIYL